ncbi:hypothetical protein AB0H73_07305 [Streptomyces olivoreticuli]|uniref:hypothetical protein n=1 Tax=Streptomyces olivoreticuli TaxID=68246 RepID=UPI000E22405E|nr:hypothetical protein [Streptomyces olivoreticuli]
MNPATAPDAAADFRPTHVVPPDGLPTWTAPDAAVPTEPLDPLLPVRLLDRRGDWGQVLCSNGWTAWTDSRPLVPLPQGPPAAGGPLTRTADARRLLARAEETLGAYHRAVADLAAGRTDGESFRRSTEGLRIGVVVDGDAVWLYDPDEDHWCYCDGTAMAVLAPGGPAAPRPASGSDPGEATRIVGPGDGR